MAGAFGQFSKQRRLGLGKTLRQFCAEHGLDPGNLSKLERGRLAPPQSREKLESYASYLELQKGSDEWIEFFDLAAAESGRVPDDLLRDEELVRKLPILFRTLRGQQVPNETLEDLIRMLKGV